MGVIYSNCPVEDQLTDEIKQSAEEADMVARYFCIAAVTHNDALAIHSLAHYYMNDTNQPPNDN